MKHHPLKNLNTHEWLLWALATAQEMRYLPMVLCFTMFLVNDLYGFYNWRKMRKRQK